MILSVTTDRNVATRDVETDVWSLFVSSSTTIEPCHEKTCLRGFRPGLTNQAVQPKKMASGLKFVTNEDEGFYNLCSENKGADPLQPICAFVFAYAKSRFSHDAAQFLLFQSAE